MANACVKTSYFSRNGNAEPFFTLNTAGTFSNKVFFHLSFAPRPYEAEISLLLGVRISRVLDRIFHLERGLKSLISTTSVLQHSIYTEHIKQLMRGHR
jgi:hypothetical protein